MAEGFDDVLFVTADGDVSEGSTWNLAVHDGERLLWPQAPALRGTAEALLKRHWPDAQLTRPLALAELGSVKAAFACNASGLWALEAIDGHVFSGSQALAERGRAVLAAVPWDRLGPDPLRRKSDLTPSEPPGLARPGSAAIIARLPRHPGDWAIGKTPWSRFD